MLEFASLGAFQNHVTQTMIPAVNTHLRHGLEAVAERIEHTAREKFGHYQPEVGPFEAWQELAEFTKQDRVAKGFAENDPLLRTGELRDSIGRAVRGFEAVIGSTSDISVYQELGTNRMPPRPFLGPAVIQNEEGIRAIWHDVLVRGFLGRGATSAAPMMRERFRDGD
jgi:phage gpG-like protein